MKHLRVDCHEPDAAVLEQAAAVILSGGIVAYPTDTLYGLAADPRNADAIERLFAIKGRGRDRAIPLIASDVDQVERHVGTMTALARRLASACWPGPLTLIIAAAPGLVEAIHAGTGRVAVRVPAHAVARGLAAASGCAITSTSANLSGQQATCLANEVQSALHDRLDALVDAGASPGGLASTIVDATGPSPVLVRPGVVPWNRVLESS
jgi:L-threonylcarbamoyladenylate synthase